MKRRTFKKIMFYEYNPFILNYNQLSILIKNYVQQLTSAKNYTITEIHYRTLSNN